MAFDIDMPAAARRNLGAADHLDSGGVAGYLYGIAAECAIKAMMVGVPSARRDDLLYLHFPDLRIQLRDSLQGRSAATLAAFVNNDGFLNNWHVKMRYSNGRQIRSEWVRAWQKQARQAVNAMGT